MGRTSVADTANLRGHMHFGLKVPGKTTRNNTCIDCGTSVTGPNTVGVKHIAGCNKVPAEVRTRAKLALEAAEMEAAAALAESEARAAKHGDGMKELSTYFKTLPDTTEDVATLALKVMDALYVIADRRSFISVESDIYHGFASLKNPASPRLSHGFVRNTVLPLASAKVVDIFLDNVRDGTFDLSGDGYKATDGEEHFALLVTAPNTGAALLRDMSVLDSKTGADQGRHVNKIAKAMKRKANALMRVVLFDNAANMGATFE